MVLKNKLLKQRVLLFAGSVLLGSLSLFHGLEWLFVIALLPFFYYLDNLKKVNKKNSLHRFLYCWACDL